MTTGSAWRLLVAFAVPLLLGNLLQQLYNMVDSIVVGNYVGAGALAAVGTSHPIINLLLSLFMGVGTGASVLISQSFGAKEYGDMRRTANTTLVLTFLGGIFLTVVGYFASPFILTAMQVQPDYYDMALIYIQVIFLGITFLMYYNIIAGILRGLGDAISPLIFLAISTVINIVLDLVFVLQFDMGVLGVALATVIAQAVSVVFAFFRMGQVSEHLTFKLSDMRIDGRLAMRSVKLGLPTGVQQALMSLGMMVVQGLINSFGTAVTASFNATMRVDMMVMMPMMTIGMAITTFTGQNVGAGRLDRVKEGVRTGLIMCVGIGVILSAGLLFFGKYIMMLFTSDQDVLTKGTQILQVLSFFYPFAGLGFYYSGVLRGAGETMMPLYSTIIAQLVIRVPVSYLLAYLLGSFAGVYWGFAMGWFLGYVFIYLYYKFGKWRDRATKYESVLDKSTAPEMPEE
jgi:putative MATE family efflux protein